MPNSPPLKNYLLQYWRDISNSQQQSLPPSNGSSGLDAPNAESPSSPDSSYGSVYRLFEVEIPASLSQFILKTNLLPGTVYRLRLYAVNEFGKSHFSANQRLTTEQEEPSLPPTDVRVHSKSTSTIKLSWRAPLKNSWNGPLTGYLVAFKMLKESEMTSVIDLQSLAASEKTFAFNTVKFTGTQLDEYYQEYTLGNLQKETLYCIMIQALNNVGHGPYSQPILVTTSNNDPPLPPTPWIDTVQKNSMIIKWTQSGNKEDLTHYILYYKDDRSVWLETTFSAKDKNSYTLNGLTEGTLYEVYMKASSHHGLSEPSKVVRQMTQSVAKETGGSLRSLQDSASRMFGQYANIPPYLRSYVVIPISVALVLIVIICSVAIGYIKYEEKKTALIQASLGMMASSPSKNFQYINSSVNSPTANITTNHLFNMANQSNSQTLNSSTVSEEGYHSLQYTDFDKSNRPLLSARPLNQASTSGQASLWVQRQSPIIEESDNQSSDPYETLKKFQTDKPSFSTPLKNQLPPPLPNGRPASMNLLTSAINISKRLEQGNLLDLTLNQTAGNSVLNNLSNISNVSSNQSSSFHPALNNSTTSSSGNYSQDLTDRKNQILADVHHRDDSDGYDFFSPHNL